MSDEIAKRTHDEKTSQKQEAMQTPKKEKREWSPLKPWQKRRLWGGILSMVIIGTVFLAVVCSIMWNDREEGTAEWLVHTALSEEEQTELEARSKAATEVLTGTYIETVKSINLKEETFRVVMLVWFRWEGSQELDMKERFRIYKGTINSQHLVEEYHEGDLHYQQMRVDVTVTKNFATKRFPLDSQQLNIYLECDYPVEKVRLRLDGDSSLNEGLHISGYRILGAHAQEYLHKYSSTHANPTLTAPEMTSEIVTSVEISRDGFGLYLKCFIALMGTTLWVFVTMFLCTYHRVDPLGMIPGALFGTVGNIMVGANVVPDALSLGLLEYVNLWGVLTVLAGALCIINMNRIRSKYGDHEFAARFGRIMFALLVIYVVAGHILMPLSAYVF